MILNCHAILQKNLSFNLNIYEYADKQVFIYELRQLGL